MGWLELTTAGQKEGYQKLAINERVRCIGAKRKIKIVAKSSETKPFVMTFHLNSGIIGLW